jgi:Meiotically up-regulated gene 113
MPKTMRHRIAPDWREWWDERVAIMEEDGRLTKEKAEEKATVCLLEWAKSHTPLDYSREGKVYIIAEEGTPFYKIGRSWSPWNRRKELQIGTANPLHVLREIYHYDCLTLEKDLHKRYKIYRKHGEWFELPEHLLSALLVEDFSCNRSSGKVQG